LPPPPKIGLPSSQFKSGYVTAIDTLATKSFRDDEYKIRLYNAGDTQTTILYKKLAQVIKKQRQTTQTTNRQQSTHKPTNHISQFW